MEKYETIEQLGEGAFAVVIKAKDLNTGSLVAIKKLKKKYQTWQECVDLREVKSLNVLKKNDNIIKLKEMIRVEDTLYLVFEYMEKNLLELIISKQSRKFNEGQIRGIMWQTLQGLAYMHKYGFFHRDLKPENLLVCGETVKIADFGLAREIRSLPPYTDYVSTRYYRAPECILKSTNYNSPIDIWALGCIMIEMYNQKPIFIGNSEKEVLFRMCSVLGTPNNTTWPEGIQSAKKIDLKFPTSPGMPLTQIIPDASKDALDFLTAMMKWDPNKRATASDLLQHPFFTKYPTPNRITTPDYNTNTSSSKNVKTYSNVKAAHGHNTQQNEIKIKTDFEADKTRKDETDFSSLLNDTKGFNEFIQKIKNEKQEEDLKFIENRNCSPIAKKNEEEFDFDLPTYFKDNQTDKTLYSNNSLLNANISNITGMGASVITNIMHNQNATIYNYNKNFFDTTTLNNINGAGSRHGSNSDDRDREIDIPITKDSDTDLFQNSRRKVHAQNSGQGINGILENVSNEINKKEEEKKKFNSKNDIDQFDNCNVYLKGDSNNPNNPNRPSTRKRSAYKFIESTLEKNSPSVQISNSVKSTKDPINDKLASQFSSFNLKNNLGGPNPILQNSGSPMGNGFTFKNSITSTNAINNTAQDKKPEYQSRRKNQMTNILNELDNPKVIDINLNSNLSNKSEIDKKDHVNIGFRKNNQISTNKDMMVAENTYKKPIGTNFNINTNQTNVNTGTGSETLGLFNSRRHVNNSNNIGGNINNKFKYI